MQTGPGDNGARHTLIPRSAWGVAAVAWATVIFAGSSVPGSLIPGHFSVAGHLSEYCVLGALSTLALRRDGKPLAAALFAIAAASAFGITDELHQLFVPMRTADPVDWLLDTAGASIGSAAVLLASGLIAAGARRQ